MPGEDVLHAAFERIPPKFSRNGGSQKHNWNRPSNTPDPFNEVGKTSRILAGRINRVTFREIYRDIRSLIQNGNDALYILQTSNGPITVQAPDVIMLWRAARK